jgi:hypothetical protein
MPSMGAKSKAAVRGERLVTFLFVALIVPLVIGFIFFSHKEDKRPWPTATAHISGTRIVAVAAEEHPFQGGTVLYRAQAHVIYEMNGSPVDRWAPASGTKRDKAYLEFWLSHKKQDSCLVRWNPSNPDDLEAVLLDDVTQNASH